MTRGEFTFAVIHDDSMNAEQQEWFVTLCSPNAEALPRTQRRRPRLQIRLHPVPDLRQTVPVQRRLALAFARGRPQPAHHQRQVQHGADTGPGGRAGQLPGGAETGPGTPAAARRSGQSHAPAVGQLPAGNNPHAAGLRLLARLSRNRAAAHSNPAARRETNFHGDRKPRNDGMSERRQYKRRQR